MKITREEKPVVRLMCEGCFFMGFYEESGTPRCPDCGGVEFRDVSPLGEAELKALAEECHAKRRHTLAFKVVDKVKGVSSVVAEKAFEAFYEECQHGTVWSGHEALNFIIGELDKC